MEESLTESPTKRMLLELETLKSKESIFKIKENNFLREKEILQDSIDTLQTEVQEKSELIRILKRDMNSKGVRSCKKSFKGRDDEIDKLSSLNDDLRKEVIILKEKLEFNEQKADSMKSEYEKQQKVYLKELEYKTKLYVLLESREQQKDQKIISLTTEIDDLKCVVSNTESNLVRQTKLNNELKQQIERIENEWLEEKSEREQEILRIRNENLQLQSNGLSELHLEKMNPTVATTLRALKSSKSLMDVYSDLHSKIDENEQLKLDRKRLSEKVKNLMEKILELETHIEKSNGEFESTMKTSNDMKTRLVSLASELRMSENKRRELERKLLVSKKRNENSEEEIKRLMEQVRAMLVESDSLIKQEEVDSNSSIFRSVQELQELNRVLRSENDSLKAQIEESDSHHFKQRFEELQLLSNRLGAQVDLLKQENSTFKRQLWLHEKQVKLLKCVLSSKCPIGSMESIENAIQWVIGNNNEYNQLEIHHSVTTSINNSSVGGSFEVIDKQRKSDSITSKTSDSRIAALEQEISDLVEDKKSSNAIFVTTIEGLRKELVETTKNSRTIQNRFDDCVEKLNEEKQLSEQYKNDSTLLRNLNKNLSRNCDGLERQLEELQMTLNIKVKLLAEAKAELDIVRNNLDLLKGQENRFKYEKDELKKLVDNQTKLLSNLSSLQSGVKLDDHLQRLQLVQKAKCMENEKLDLLNSLKIKEEEIACLKQSLNESKELIVELNKKPANADKIDAECQASSMPDRQLKKQKVDEALKQSVEDYRAKVSVLEKQITVEKMSIDNLKQQLQSVTDNYEAEMKELNQKIDHLESKIIVIEKDRQDTVTENVNLTEQGREMTMAFKAEIQAYQGDLENMKVRLEEAEAVERTAQSVIDKHIKESQEAKAKYQRELTLHAADSKLLESMNAELEIFRTGQSSVAAEIEQLKEKLTIEQKRSSNISVELRATIGKLESDIQQSDTVNDNLYRKLHEISHKPNFDVYNQIIEDLRNQVNILKMTSTLSAVEKERYEFEITKLTTRCNELLHELDAERVKVRKNLNDSSSSDIDLDIVKESNSLLRKQKELLEISNSSNKKEICDLKEQLTKMSQNLSQYQDQNNKLLAGRTEIENERNLWKDRFSKLIERAEQTDPEQYRLVCNERDKLKKRIHQLEEDCERSKTTFETLKMETANLQSQFDDSQKKSKAQDERALQLRDIARKYRSESEKKKQELADLENRNKELLEQYSVLNSEAEKSNKLTNGQLEEKIREIMELKTRCDALQQTEIEMSKRLQLTQSFLQRSQEELQKYKMEGLSLKKRRQSISSDNINEDDEEPAVKRMKTNSESAEEDSLESEEEEEHNSLPIQKGDEDNENFQSKCDEKLVRQPLFAVQLLSFENTAEIENFKKNNEIIEEVSGNVTTPDISANNFHTTESSQIEIHEKDIGIGTLLEEGEIVEDISMVSVEKENAKECRNNEGEVEDEESMVFIEGENHREGSIEEGEVEEEESLVFIERENSNELSFNYGEIKEEESMISTEGDNLKECSSEVREIKEKESLVFIDRERPIEWSNEEKAMNSIETYNFKECGSEENVEIIHKSARNEMIGEIEEDSQKEIEEEELTDLVVEEPKSEIDKSGDDMNSIDVKNNEIMEKTLICVDSDDENSLSSSALEISEVSNLDPNKSTLEKVDQELKREEENDTNINSAGVVEEEEVNDEDHEDEQGCDEDCSNHSMNNDEEIHKHSSDADIDDSGNEDEVMIIDDTSSSDNDGRTNNQNRLQRKSQFSDGDDDIVDSKNSMFSTTTRIAAVLPSITTPVSSPPILHKSVSSTQNSPMSDSALPSLPSSRIRKLRRF